MSLHRYNADKRQVVWLTVEYSPVAGMWLITTTFPAFITRKLATEFLAIEGTRIVYMVRGFDNLIDAQAFAITYDKAKRDGIVHRFRLD